MALAGDNRLTVLGARGTAPSSGSEYIKYGCATTCFLLRFGGERIILDAGSGLLGLERRLDEGGNDFSMLISHPHVDHLIGLTSCQLLFDENARLAVYAVPRGGLSAREQVETLMSTPLWPVGPSDFKAEVTFHDISEETFYIGKVRVDCMEGWHPGGCTVFRLSFGEKSVVYATDFEEGSDADDGLALFAKDCTLLLCDGKYTVDELPPVRGFGHSSYNFVAALGKKTGALKTLIIHHSPNRTDTELDLMGASIKESFPQCHFAKEGDDFAF